MTDIVDQLRHYAISMRTSPTLAASSIHLAERAADEIEMLRQTLSRGTRHRHTPEENEAYAQAWLASFADNSEPAHFEK